MNTSRIGIIGCGNISPAYASTLSDFPWIEIAAFADGIPERAEKFAARYGGVAMELSAMLADDSIDAVVNLTPAHAHTSVSRLCLDAGKPVFSEKPLGTDFEEGRELVELADAKGLRLGCAPDTFLGAGLQAARNAVDRGLIGEPIAANGFMLGFGPEWWHPAPEGFYVPGAGPLFDMGPYYLTALVQLLGPARSISGSAKIGIAERVVHSKGRVGDVVQATTPTHVSSLIDFVGGASATLVTSFDVKATRFRNIEIYGTEGTLSVPDPNTFGGPLKIRNILADDWREVSLPTPNIPQQRGIGLADMLSATSSNRPHRASAEQALHVLELMSATLRSSDEGRRVDLTTTCERPAPLRFDLPANTFDD
ncbi:MAG TPA: Gfo/Idh/MocA family oxidoreductase [Ilumatobacteraceae bacterium]|nr:Gfo/Idh/MocA family oxidoreductase [Ilumatobacteraceae bacterium]